MGRVKIQMFSQKIISLSTQIRDFCILHQLKLTAAESCTGGLIASAITEIQDSSKIFEYGFVVYSVKSKNKLLDVDLEVVKKYGVVSSEVAKVMAINAALKSCSDIAISSTGYVGPSADDGSKLGCIFIGLYYKGGVFVSKLDYSWIIKSENSRSEIRAKVVESALQMVVDLCTKV